jgi:teichuronic acid exporter
LQVLNLNILKVKGRSDLFLKLEIIKKATVVLAIVLTYRHGIIVMLYGQIITSIIAYLLNSYYSGHLIDYSQWDQIKDITPSLGSAVTMGIVMYLVGLLPTESHLLKILFQTITGILVYYLISLKASSSELAEVKSIVINAMIQIILKLKGALCRTR